MKTCDPCGRYGYQRVGVGVWKKYPPVTRVIPYPWQVAWWRKVRTIFSFETMLIEEISYNQVSRHSSWPQTTKTRNTVAMHSKNIPLFFIVASLMSTLMGQWNFDTVNLFTPTLWPRASPSGGNSMAFFRLNHKDCSGLPWGFSGQPAPAVTGAGFYGHGLWVL